MKTSRFTVTPRLNSSLAGALLAGVGALGSPVAHATITTYLSPADFAAAEPGAINNVFPVDGSGNTLPRPYIQGALGFGSTNHFGRLYLQNDTSYGPLQSYLATIYPAGTINSTIDVQDGTTAYGLAFNFGTLDGADTITYKVNDVVIGTFNTSATGSTVFFGVTDTDPITRLSFTTNTGTEFDIMNFEVATAQAVPEPSTCALVGTAAVGGFGLLRRRKARSAA